MLQPELSLFAEPLVVKLEWPEDVLRRWWVKVDKRGPDECWLWKASKNKQGYGRFWLADAYMFAHRISFELHYRLLKPGECALHNCPDGDTPGCVNPAHLWAGTKADNNKDRDRKGRQVVPRGEENGRAKLTETQVIEIRARYAAGDITLQRLAAEFGVSLQLIWEIVNRRVWAHVLS